MAEETPPNAVELATELTIAWLGNHNTRVAANDVPAFLRTMHASLIGLADNAPSSTSDGDGGTATEHHTPAVSVRKSLASRDHILSMIDGKPYKTLRRHLAGHGLTPEQYRERYKLKTDYPMVAETYSEARRAMAKKIGLGRKLGQAAIATPADGPETPPRRSRTRAS